MATETTIRTALLSRLQSLALSPAHPIAWENVPFTPPASGRYLKAYIMPVVKRGISLGDDGTNEHGGILQIDVMAPLGTGAASPIVETILSHFKRGVRLYQPGVRIEIVRAKPETGFVDGPSWKTPVSITYRALAPNA